MQKFDFVGEKKIPIFFRYFGANFGELWETFWENMGNASEKRGNALENAWKKDGSKFQNWLVRIFLNYTNHPIFARSFHR